MAESYHPIDDERLVWRDPDAARERLEHFRMYGRRLLHLVTDWDGTIVPGKGTSWHVMSASLPPGPGGQDAHRALYKTNFALQQSGLLTPEAERQWSREALELHVTHKTPHARLIAEAKKIAPRKGAKELFRVLTQAGTPIIALSAGVRQVIEGTATEYDLFDLSRHASDIIATELLMADGPDGEIVVGWDEDTLVDSSTKKEKGHEELAAVRRQFPYILLLGDQPHDADMVDKNDESIEAIRVRVDGLEIVNGATWGDYLDQSWEAGYDAVITGEELFAVVGLAQWLTDPMVH